MPLVRFNQLRNASDLGLVWGVAVEDLETIAAAPSQRGWYREMQIPKRGKANRGQFRTVYKVEWGTLEQLQKNISRDIDDSISLPDCAQGFLRKRSAVTNAAVHSGQRVVLHADIKDFFDSITADQVRGAFIRLGCNDEITDRLVKICTLDGRLPQGASTSSIVSNLVCSGLDADLLAFARQQSALYTRYGDDLTLSGETPPDPDVVRRIVGLHGFKLRADKGRIQWRGKSQYVTGLCVASPSGPRLPVRAKRRLRLELYYAKKYGLDNHLARVQRDWSGMRLLAFFRGWIDYMGSVPAEKALAERLRKELDALQ
jgi:RNA-directed DNA polymerase